MRHVIRIAFSMPHENKRQSAGTSDYSMDHETFREVWNFITEYKEQSVCFWLNMRHMVASPLRGSRDAVLPSAHGGGRFTAIGVLLTHPFQPCKRKPQPSSIFPFLNHKNRLMMNDTLKSIENHNRKRMTSYSREWRMI